VDTKSGLNAPWNGSLSLSAASFDSGGANLEVAENLHKKVGVFLSSQTNRTRRYLDPPEIEACTMLAERRKLFTRFDLHRPSMTSALESLYQRTDYQVANTQTSRMPAEAAPGAAR